MKVYLCTHESCSRPVHVRKWMLCSKHYSDHLRAQKPECNYPKCSKKAGGEGLCKGHRSQKEKLQELRELRAARRSRDHASMQEKISFHTEVDPHSGCHIWSGAKAYGYGRVSDLDGMPASAHREAYKLAFGEIPEGSSFITSAPAAHASTPSTCSW